MNYVAPVYAVIVLVVAVVWFWHAKKEYRLGYPMIVDGVVDHPSKESTARNVIRHEGKHDLS